MALVRRSMTLLALFAVFALAQKGSSLLTFGYGTLYNSAVNDSLKLSGHLLRAEYVYTYGDYGATLDAQLLDAGQGDKAPFALAEASYRVLNQAWFPELWMGGAFLYADSLGQEGLLENLEMREPGLGMTCAFHTGWFEKGYGNFSMRYFPKSQALYKSMQIGWNILPHLGVSFGGLGIRIPEGRYYSSFVFATRVEF